MKKDLFYKRQRAGNAIYFTLVGVTLALLAASIFGAIAMILLASPGDVWALEFTVLTLASLVLFLGVYHFFGSVRRQTYRRYRRLSDREKQQMNSELAAKFRGGLCGEDLFYYKRICFVCFLPYGDIAWVYRHNAQIPMVPQSGPYLVESSLTTSKLVLYTRDGKRYVADTALDTSLVLSTLMDRAPEVIYGYSKERLRMAKQDMERFVMEYGGTGN